MREKRKLSDDSHLRLAKPRRPHGKTLSSDRGCPVPPDRELIRRILSGKKEAYQTLVERYQERAYRIAFDLLRSEEDARDIVQESFVKAYLSLDKFRQDSSFYTWFYRIVHNMAIDYKRKVIRRGGDPVEYEEEGVNISASSTSYSQRPGQDPQQAAIDKQELGILNRAMVELTEEQRTTLRLREIDGLSYDEIATVTEVSKGTVMSRLHYARKNIQNTFAALRKERPVEKGKNAPDDDK